MPGQLLKIILRKIERFRVSGRGLIDDWLVVQEERFKGLQSIKCGVLYSVITELCMKKVKDEVLKQVDEKEQICVSSFFFYRNWYLKINK